MSSTFERNVSSKSPRDVEAEGIARLLAERDRQFDINLDFPRYLERTLAPMWLAEGYSAPQVFVDPLGSPIIIGRYEDPSPYDVQGVIKPSADVCYRFYLEDEVRDVTVPRELAGDVSQSMSHGDAGIYNASEAGVLQLILREDAALFAEDLEWLRDRFGKSLAITRPALSSPRLDGDDRVVGVSLDSFPPFSDGDF